MRPAWRLAINNLSARRNRTLLLIATVVLSSSLIAVVSCAVASMHVGLRKRVEAAVGASDLRADKTGKDLFSLDVVQSMESWPEVKLAVGRLRDALTLQNPRSGRTASMIANGIMLDREFKLRPLDLAEGRLPAADNEIVLDAQAARALSANLGDTLTLKRPDSALSKALSGALGNLIKKPPAPTDPPSASSASSALPSPALLVVGISKQPAIGMGIVLRSEAFLSRDTLAALTGRARVITDADLVLHDSSNAPRLAAAHKHDFEKGINLRPSTKITSGLDSSIRQSQLGMTIISVLAYLAASFIIMTGLTTNVNERQRELAMLRCIGGTRWQMAENQLVTGAIIGAIGALVGVPLGMLGALALVRAFPDQLPGGFAVNPLGLSLALVGSLGAGLLGAVWPAIRAARTSPLEAMTVRSRPARRRGIILCAALGLALALLQLAIIHISQDPNIVLWGDIAVGLPAMFTGYFLLSVPVMSLAALAVAPALGRALRIPSNLLSRTVRAAPYRFGFTAGSMALGLSLLVAIWTNGRSVLEDWLNGLKFPDAFAAGVAIPEETRTQIEGLPFVTGTVAIQMLPMRTRAFGVDAFDNALTTFIAFEPDSFFKMTTLTWIEGSPETAIPRLKQGGAVLVAREFKTSRNISVGDTLTLTYNDTPYPFEVVGVVSSPGLDIVNSWFEIGEDYAEQAVNAVFGTRADMQRLFGVNSIRLLQIGLNPHVNGRTLTDAEMMQTIKDTAAAGAGGIIDAGSGRTIINEIRTYLTGSLYVFSLVAVGAMFIACFGVANLIVAGIQARQFEFGVLRAIGAQRGLLARMIIGEALLIALTACIIGTVMGIHAAKAGQRVNEVLIGLSLKGWPPLWPTLAGCLAVTLITLAAAAPAILSLNRKHPRELLGAMKG